MLMSGINSAGGPALRIIVADDHELVRDGLCSLIERNDPGADIHACSSLQGVRAALQADPAYDLVLLDVYMPGMNGLAGAVSILEQHPGVRVVLMSGIAGPADMVRAMRLGVHGFIPKNLPGRGLMAALNLVMSGERYLPVELMLVANAPPPRLSEREQSIAAQLRLGKTNKQIALDLGLEEVTVKSAIRAVGVKLGARKRAEIALRSLHAETDEAL